MQSRVTFGSKQRFHGDRARLIKLPKTASPHPVNFHALPAAHISKYLSPAANEMDNLKDKSIHFTAQTISEEIRQMPMYKGFYNEVQVRNLFEPV